MPKDDVRLAVPTMKKSKGNRVLAPQRWEKATAMWQVDHGAYAWEQAPPGKRKQWLPSFGQHREFDDMMAWAVMRVSPGGGLWQHTKRDGVPPSGRRRAFAMLRVGPSTLIGKPRPTLLDVARYGARG